VRHYLERFGAHPGHRVPDPFCGTATTLVECKKHGIEGIGIEGNPVAHFAGCVKTAWEVNPGALVTEGQRIAELAREQLLRLGIQDEMPLFPTLPVDIALRTLPTEQEALLLTNSMSPLPLHKALVLRDSIYQEAEPAYQCHLLLALIKALVNNASNLHFGPEVGLGAIKADAAVIAPWLANVQAMVQDIRAFQDNQPTPSLIHHGDARNVATLLPERSIDFVITSPPYPNEKDYTRTTRLEAVFLGFIHNKADLRAMKKGLVRSNTRGVYKEDNDHKWIANLPRIQELAEHIEQRRIELGKTSGFERLYARGAPLFRWDGPPLRSAAHQPGSWRQACVCGWRSSVILSDYDSHRRYSVRHREELRVSCATCRSIPYPACNSHPRADARRGGRFAVAWLEMRRYVTKPEDCSHFNSPGSGHWNVDSTCLVLIRTPCRVADPAANSSTAVPWGGAERIAKECAAKRVNQ
jgi:hypothetical protein